MQVAGCSFQGRIGEVCWWVGWAVCVGMAGVVQYTCKLHVCVLATVHGERCDRVPRLVGSSVDNQ